MSGVALDVPLVPTHRSFLRLLVGVLVGSFLSSVIVFVVSLPLYGLGLLPGLEVWPLPFHVDGAWSLGADLALATGPVLNWAWWVRGSIADAVRGPVSFGVVVMAVVLVGYAPFFGLNATWFWLIVSLLAVTWVIRRFAIGTTLLFPRPSRRVWAALAVVGVGLFGSYSVYHPLAAAVDDLALTQAPVSGTLSTSGTLKNSGWADVTILRVDHGWLAARKLPYTLKAHSQTDLFFVINRCAPRDVNVTFSVLGRTSSQQFTFTPASCRS